MRRCMQMAQQAAAFACKKWSAAVFGYSDLRRVKRLNISSISMDNVAVPEDGHTPI